MRTVPRAAHRASTDAQLNVIARSPLDHFTKNATPERFHLDGTIALLDTPWRAQKSWIRRTRKIAEKTYDSTVLPRTLLKDVKPNTQPLTLVDCRAHGRSVFDNGERYLV